MNHPQGPSTLACRRFGIPGGRRRSLASLRTSSGHCGRQVASGQKLIGFAKVFSKIRGRYASDTRATESDTRKNYRLRRSARVDTRKHCRLLEAIAKYTRKNERLHRSTREVYARDLATSPKKSRSIRERFVDFTEAYAKYTRETYRLHRSTREVYARNLSALSKHSRSIRGRFLDSPENLAK